MAGRILKAECHILRTGEGIYEVAQDAVYFVTYFFCVVLGNWDLVYHSYNPKLIHILLYSIQKICTKILYNYNIMYKKGLQSART